jgi:hypothetical protein
MSTPDGVMWFPKSHRRRVHFKNRHAPIVRIEGNVLENQSVCRLSKGLPIARNTGKAIGPTPAADC